MRNFKPARLVCLTILGVATFVQAQSPPTYEQTLANVRAATRLETTAMQVRLKITQSADGKPGNTENWINLFCYDGNSLDLKYQRGSASQFNEKKTYNRILVRGDEYFSYPAAEGLPAKVVHTGQSKTAIYEWRQNPQTSRSLDGEIAGLGARNVVDALDPTGTLGNEVVNGIPCIALSSRTKFGDITVWTSPERGYALVKYTIQRSATSTWVDAVRDEIAWKERPVGGNAPSEQSKTQIALLVQSVQADRIEKVGERWFAHAGVLETTTRFDDGSTQTESVAIERDRIDVQPDFAALGAFTMPEVLDGTPVRAREFENTGIQYEMQKGKVVPSIDTAVVQTIDDAARMYRKPNQPLATATVLTPNAASKSANGAFTSFLIYLTAGISVVAAIVAVVAYTIRRGRASGQQG